MRNDRKDAVATYCTIISAERLNSQPFRFRSGLLLENNMDEADLGHSRTALWTALIGQN
jgi:hypothetical protein